MGKIKNKNILFLIKTPILKILKNFVIIYIQDLKKFLEFSLKKFLTPA